MLSESFVVEDSRFRRLVMGNVAVEKLFTGTRWAEGPAYFPAGRYLIWSDIPNDRLMRYDEPSGAVSVFEHPCGFHNGHTVDREGRLIACEHGGRRISRLELDGRWRTLADSYNGHPLNSPNDVIVKSDGTVWFTDPTYGIDGDYEGHKAPSEQGGSYLYRLDPDTGAISVAASDFVKPNGLAFSPDESILYVADTGATHVENGPHHIRALTMAADGQSIASSRLFADCDNGLFDGFRVDRQGNIWASAADGVQCYASDGTRLGRIRIPEVVANVEFGGRKRNRLYICGTTSLYSVFLNTAAAPRPSAAAV